MKTSHNIATWRTALLEEIICNISHINSQEIISIFCPVLLELGLKIVEQQGPHGIKQSLMSINMHKIQLIFFINLLPVIFGIIFYFMLHSAQSTL